MRNGVEKKAEDRLRIVFFGTPDFAVPALRALHEAGYPVVCCVTQPDRAKGRSDAKVMPPVKVFAMENGIPVLQPDKVRDRGCVQALRAFGADVFVVAAFGQILPGEVLHLPPLGCVNLHASLLPRWRGAAPIQHAILAGDSETGVTLMQMDEGCDTGRMLAKTRVPILETDTGGSLFETLALAAAELIVESLPKLADGTLKGEAQDESLATPAAKLTKEMGRIDWTKGTDEILRTVRAFDPWPSAYTTCGKKLLKINAAHSVPGDGTGEESTPGLVLAATRQGLLVRTGDGVLQIDRLQPEGKKPMDAASFLNGNTLESGMRLGA